MYVLNSSTKETLFRFLDLIQPELEHDGKVEALRRAYESLRLHDLPFFFALFIFDCAVFDVKSAIKLKDVALTKKHWFPLILARIELIGTDRLKQVMQFIKPLEEGSHEKKSQSNEGSRDKSFIIGKGGQSYR